MECRNVLRSRDNVLIGIHGILLGDGVTGTFSLFGYVFFSVLRRISFPCFIESEVVDIRDVFFRFSCLCGICYCEWLAGQSFSKDFNSFCVDLEVLKRKLEMVIWR